METVILETIHGSRAYGIATASSDTDRKGIYVADREAYFGYKEAPEQIEHSPDHVVYDIRKFFRMASTCNPSIIEVLYTEEEDLTVIRDAGKVLRQHRKAFLSKRAGDSFGGYALAQLKRIKTHRRWLLHPPTKKPERVDYGLPQTHTISRDQLGAAEALLESGSISETSIAPNFMEIVDKERRYRAATKEWEQYQTWLKHRNPERAELERKFGLDCKHAGHLVRLMRMAEEILLTGEVKVRRPDAEELRAIRQGALTYEQILASAESLGERIKKAVEVSALPEHPDEVFLNMLCIEVTRVTHAVSGAF